MQNSCLFLLVRILVNLTRSSQIPTRTFMEDSCFFLLVRILALGRSYKIMSDSDNGSGKFLPDLARYFYQGFVCGSL